MVKIKSLNYVVLSLAPLVATHKDLYAIQHFFQISGKIFGCIKLGDHLLLPTPKLKCYQEAKTSCLAVTHLCDVYTNGIFTKCLFVLWL